MHRRTGLGGLAAAATPVVAASPETADASGGRAAALRLSTTAYRRLDGTTPSRDLTETVEFHIRLIQSVTRSATGNSDRARLAAVGSEAASFAPHCGERSAASFAGWLAWDKGDYGSARSWYGGAIKAARTAGNPLLTAYQTGLLAQFEAHAGNGGEAHRIRRRHETALAAAIAEVTGAPEGDVRVAALARFVMESPSLVHGCEDPRRALDEIFDLLKRGWTDGSR
ncbi:hypothetical protein ACFYZE_25030 [Streptomyces sp. NPDC001796]|uniref:hypothetical protein n=1 Tax=Streptomyces sp. NPDC001796 TaxID=3364609 RepID=UPI0036ADF898